MIRFALIPAAGKSERMGQPKLSLPLGDKTVLEHVLLTLFQSGIKQSLVVLGPSSASLEPLASSAGADILLLSDSTPDMRATIERGLDWAEKAYRPDPADFWLLCPADHPLLDASVVAALTETVTVQPSCTIALPTHSGQRGHPALIRWSHVDGIRRLPPNNGLNAYLRQFQHETVEVPWASDAVLADLDTPEDYGRVLGRLS